LAAANSNRIVRTVLTSTGPDHQQPTGPAQGPAEKAIFSLMHRIVHSWTWLAPLLACLLFLIAVQVGMKPWLILACTVGLFAAVLAAVHHAEVVAHRVGEPLGTLVLALAVTGIETALIVSLMVAGGPESAVLPRDAIYRAVMIICTGVVGFCVLLGGENHLVN